MVRNRLLGFLHHVHQSVKIDIERNINAGNTGPKGCVKFQHHGFSVLRYQHERILISINNIARSCDWDCDTPALLPLKLSSDS